jgi:hypothetical protein
MPPLNNVSSSRTAASAWFWPCRRVDLRDLLQLAHALGGLGAEQVALAGMHAQQLAAGGKLEALGGAAMGFELSLWL